MLKIYLEKLLHLDSLDTRESEEAILTVIHQEVPAEQIAAFLALLRAKGETSAEILGTISALKTQMRTVTTQKVCLDIVGTGGDQSNSVNISSAASILAAACGVPIAKHGNRAVSSQAGAADVLQALQINIELEDAAVAACIDQLNIGFCFAPRFHPALAKLRDLRKRLGFRTIFNLAAPFLNPAGAQHYVLGVYSPACMPLFAEILLALKVRRSAVVHSEGLDEMTCLGKTQVIEVHQGQMRSYELNPMQFSLHCYARGALRGGDAQQNAQLLLQAFSGESGAIADTIIFNAAMAIYLYGITVDLQQAVNVARAGLQQGAALQLLKKWKRYA